MVIDDSKFKVLKAKDLYDYYKTVVDKKNRLKPIEFRKILQDYFMEVSKELALNKAYPLGKNAGRIAMMHNRRSFTTGHLLVDYKKTNLKKKELISLGKTPYVEYKNEDGNKIGDNGGEKYLVYFIEDGFVSFEWKSIYESFTKDSTVLYCNLYKFEPARFNKRLDKTLIN